MEFPENLTAATTGELVRLIEYHNRLYWEKIYQSLNQYEEEKTEIADQELTLGDKVTSTEQAGERMVEHVIQ